MEATLSLYRIRKTREKYRRLSARIHKSFHTGEWFTFNPRRRSSLCNQLIRYAKQLYRLANKPLLGLGFLLLNPIASRIIEAQQFVQTGLTEPFGLSAATLQSDPTLVDIDNDGDLDAFIGSYEELRFLHNTGSPQSPEFIYVTNIPFGINVTAANYTSPEFVDIDGDGDVDCFINSTNNIQFFENTGDASLPQFVEQTSHALSGVDLGTSEKFAFVDIDGDNDYDLFVGEASGSTFFLENTGSKLLPSFSSPVTSPFGLSNVGAYSRPELTDVDNDGDLDAFVGEQMGSIFFFENTGSSSMPAFADSLRDPFGINPVGGYASPSLVDIDADGDLDLLLGSQDGYTYFFAGSDGIADFVLRSSANPFGISNLSFGYSAPTFVDIDADGDFDGFIGDFIGNTTFFENTGSPRNPDFVRHSSSTPFGLSDVGLDASPTFVDINDNGVQDAFIGALSGNTTFFENTGTATVAQFVANPSSAPFGLSDIGTYARPTFVDIDADGDQDVFVGDYYGKTIFFENSGSPNAPMFSVSTATSPYGIVELSYDAAPAFVDLDVDGDLDAIIGSNYGNFTFFENTGTISTPAFILSSSAQPFGLSYVDNNSTPTFVDIDNDGDLDAFVGGYDGNTAFFENQSCKEFNIINHTQLGQSYFQSGTEIESAAFIREGRSIEFQSLQITLKPKFEVEQGAQFDIFIGGCKL